MGLLQKSILALRGTSFTSVLYAPMSMGWNLPQRRGRMWAHGEHSTWPPTVSFTVHYLCLSGLRSHNHQPVPARAAGCVVFHAPHQLILSHTTNHATLLPLSPSRDCDISLPADARCVSLLPAGKAPSRLAGA